MLEKEKRMAAKKKYDRRDCDRSRKGVRGGWNSRRENRKPEDGFRRTVGLRRPTGANKAIPLRVAICRVFTDPVRRYTVLREAY